MKNKKEAQILFLLAITTSAWKILMAHPGIPKEIQSKVSNAYLINDSLILNIPLPNNYQQIRTWSSSKLKEWANVEYEGSMEEWHPAVLAVMISDICNDMLASDISNQTTKESISYIGKSATDLGYIFLEDMTADEEGIQFDEASTMIRQLYQTIGWK